MGYCVCKILLLSSVDSPYGHIHKLDLYYYCHLQSSSFVVRLCPTQGKEHEWNKSLWNDTYSIVTAVAHVREHQYTNFILKTRTVLKDAFGYL